MFGSASGARRRDRDAAWIRRILHGSERAADALVREHYDGLFAFVYRQVGDREETMNLTQETFIAALKSLPSYDPDRASFTTWLYRIAAYKVIDFRRRTNPEAVSLDSAEDGASWDVPDERLADTAELVANRELLGRIEERVAACDPAVQEAFRLHLYAGQGFAQIAAAAGESESTVKARYYRLMAMLRKEFGDETH
ncbi:RNA polymerase sigma factor [Bifidobacterium avesanii]|uniref:Sigma-70 family RNA polymerase sigma factor n=1 Tax=Bifidobacterium avesanii TaxID=1798157 RepID=A0A7K3TFC8_9BIFI|nr:sigma-70 family RNA polymerase sigma factor [Bifidobacterium avesanii]KAB8295602.1 RNA polymerase subunit sigma-24 [Bifidobacterium avesanii]NEG77606.1 sigma-70 family RNA polymerase sigma factor [Bifidobacterium avesanii]